MYTFRSMIQLALILTSRTALGVPSKSLQNANHIQLEAFETVNQTLLSPQAQHNRFTIIGRSGVPAMHAALLQSGKVIFLDKIESYTELRLESGHYAYSSLYDPELHHLTPIKVHSNAFCAAGSFLADGRLIAVGGNEPLQWLDPTVNDGLRAIRFLHHEATRYGWQEQGTSLASKRWYATSQVLADGRVFVAAGASNGIDPASKDHVNPTYEILNRNGKPIGQNIPMAILTKNVPYWMYPFVHLLKDGTVFVFVSKSSQVFNVTNNRIVKELPDLKGLHRTYPNTGGSVMLALKATND